MIHKERNKVFENAVLAFLFPSGFGNTILVGQLDTSGVVRRPLKKPEGVSIGTCIALQLLVLSSNKFS